MSTKPTKRPSKKDLKLVEAVLESMGEDLAEVVEQYGLGSCMVRAFRDCNGVTVVAKAHELTLWSGSAPSELVSVRRRIGE